jgi:membrane protease YdiL (CAAX protease family)
LASSDNPQPESQAPQNSEQPTLFPHPSEPVFSQAVLNPVMPPRREDPVWNGWDVVLIVCLTIATMFFAQFAILFGAQYLFYPHATLMELAQKPLLLLISTSVIEVAVVIYLILLVEGRYHASFGNAIRWSWPRNGWNLLLLGGVMLLVLSMLENLLPMPKDTPFDKLFARPRDAYLLSIIAVSLGPLVEELFFRGFFYPVLARRWGVVWAVILTALPFALMHMPQYGYAWGALAVIFVVGLVCGTVRAVTKSVGASFLVHAGYNGAQMIIALVVTRGFTHVPKALATVGLH